MTTKSDQSDNKEDKAENKSSESSERKDSESATIEDVKRIVDEAIESVKEFLNSSDDSDVGDDSESKTEEKTKEPEKRVRRSYATIEADARRLVEEQVRSVLGDIEHKKEHEEIKKKQPAQKAPIKVRRSTRFWLGKDYGNE